VSARIENWSDIRELVLMSIGTNKGTWWADPGLGSEMWLLKQKGKIDGGTADALKRMIHESLQWLITDALAKKIDVETERQGKNTIAYSVTVYRQDATSVIIKEVWNAV
jgi:phage gp46-like protein